MFLNFNLDRLAPRLSHSSAQMQSTKLRISMEHNIRQVLKLSPMTNITPLADFVLRRSRYKHNKLASRNADVHRLYY
jgi:hypothetical protein